MEPQDCSCSDMLPGGGGQQGFLMDESSPSFVLSPEAPRYPGMNQTFRAITYGSPGGLSYPGNIMNDTPPNLVSSSPLGASYPGDVMRRTHSDYFPSPNYPSNIMHETCPSLASPGSPVTPRYPGNIMEESCPSLYGSPSPLGPRYPGLLMDETPPGLVPSSPSRLRPRFPGLITNESPPGLVPSSPSRSRPRYPGLIMDETPPGLVPSSPSRSRPRYPGLIMNETPPGLVPGSPSPFGPRYRGPSSQVPRYQTRITHETPPSLLSGSPYPPEPRYYSRIMHETPPSLVSGSPYLPGPGMHPFMFDESPPNLVPGSPAYLMDESYPTFASGGSPAFSHGGTQNRSRNISGRYVQNRTLPPGTPDIFGTPGSDFLVSGEHLGFGTPSWPQMSGRALSTPTDSLLVSGGSFRGTPSPHRTIHTHHSATASRPGATPSSPQAHSRNQVALLSENQSSPPCPCPDDKIKSIAKRSFSPASIKEARNNIVESIESHLKNEEPLEFSEVVNSVKNYQALRRQVITGQGPESVPRNIDDIGPYATFQGGTKTTSSPPRYHRHR